MFLEHGVCYSKVLACSLSVTHDKDGSCRQFIIHVLACQQQHTNFQNYRQVNEFCPVYLYSLPCYTCKSAAEFHMP